MFPPRASTEATPSEMSESRCHCVELYVCVLTCPVLAHFWLFFHPSPQDPFGEKRGRFDYQGLLARLSATHRRIREKSLAEDDHNDDDSDSDTSSSGTDPDSQGSSQP